MPEYPEQKELEQPSTLHAQSLKVRPGFLDASTTYTNPDGQLEAARPPIACSGTPEHTASTGSCHSDLDHIQDPLQVSEPDQQPIVSEESNKDAAGDNPELPQASEPHPQPLNLEFYGLLDVVSAILRRSARLSSKRMHHLSLKSELQDHWQMSSGLRDFYHESFDTLMGALSASATSGHWQDSVSDLERLHSVAKSDWKALEEHEAKTRKLEAYQSSSEYSILQLETSLAKAVEILTARLQGSSGFEALDLDLEGSISDLSEERASSPGMHPALTHYYDKLGYERIMRERIQELKIDRDEELDRKALRAEQESPFGSETTEDGQSEEEFLERLTVAEADYQEAMSKAEEARIACINLGLDPDVRRGSITEDEELDHDNEPPPALHVGAIKSPKSSPELIRNPTWSIINQPLHSSMPALGPPRSDSDSDLDLPKARAINEWLETSGIDLFKPLGPTLEPSYSDAQATLSPPGEGIAVTSTPMWQRLRAIFGTKSVTNSTAAEDLPTALSENAPGPASNKSLQDEEPSVEGPVPPP